LTWNISQLSSGVISVSGGARIVISSTKVSGGNLIFGGSGGTAGAPYQVLTSSNLLSGIWVPIATNAFDSSGNFSVTNVIAPGVPHEFYLIKY
jgi:hypothetical protein